MKWLAVLLVLCTTTAFAGQTRRTSRQIIVYTVPLYQPVVIHYSNWGINRMPNNPVYTHHWSYTARPANRPGPISTKGRATSMPHYSNNPKLIINPYVSQKGW